MEGEYALTPLSESLLGLGVTIVGALIVSRLMSRYLNKKFDELAERDRQRLLEMEVPQP